MAFTVEDGTGVAGANSYVSIAEADAYFDDRDDSDWDALSDEAKQTALLDAAQYLDATYAWIGTKKAQANGLDWPRVNVADPDGYSVDDDVIPEAIKESVYILAKESSSAALLPSQDRGGAIKREMVKADVVESETEYFSGAPANKPYPLVDRLLAGWFEFKVGGANVPVLAQA